MNSMSDTNEKKHNSVLYSDELKELIGIDTVQLLKCGICWEFYESPIVLPCGHTFCFECLMEMGKHARKNKIHIPAHELLIACPNCRAPIKVAALSTRQVTSNYTLQSLIETLQSIARPEQIEKDIKMTAEISTNTSIEEKMYVYNKDKLDDLEAEFDGAIQSYNANKCILNEVKDEVEKIREEFKDSIIAEISTSNSNANKSNKNDNAIEPHEEHRKETPNKMFKMIKKRPQRQRNFPDNKFDPNMGFDPAILSYSVAAPQFPSFDKNSGLLPVPFFEPGKGWVLNLQTQTVNY